MIDFLQKNLDRSKKNTHRFPVYLEFLKNKIKSIKIEKSVLKQIKTEEEKKNKQTKNKIMNSSSKVNSMLLIDVKIKKKNRR